MTFLLRLALLLPILFSIFLIGCAGKKSSTSSNGEFTSWGAVSPNVTTHFSSGNSTAISSGGTVSQTSSNVNANILYDSGGNISAVTLNQTPLNFVSYSVSAGDSILNDASGANTIFTSKNQTTIGILANPIPYGFQYQTYGAWGAFGNAGSAGYAVSIGSLSPVGGIPSVGNAVFNGGANGYLIDGSKYSYVINALMTANVDFSARQITFSTTQTSIVGKSGGITSSLPGLNLSGNMSYSSGSNRITGTVSSASGMSGNIIANFYGPSANEIGGTFGLTQPTSGNSLVGGFGGKR
jgi:hypothetical protein